MPRREMTNRSIVMAATVRKSKRQSVRKVEAENRKKEAEIRKEDVGKRQEPGEKHSDGTVARGIEHHAAQVPSDVFLWAAGGSIVGSLALMAAGKRHGSLFVGQLAPTFLLLGIYNKLVKVAGSDRTVG